MRKRAAINLFALILAAAYVSRDVFVLCETRTGVVTNDGHTLFCERFEGLSLVCHFLGEAESEHQRIIVGAAPEQINAFCNDVTSIMVLEITFTELAYMKPNCLRNFPYLTNADLSHNRILKIENGLFSNMKNLEKLDLSYNSIEDIEEGSLAGDEELKYLYLKGNKITYLSDSLFSDLFSLEELHLKQNRVAEINILTFSTLYSLKQLDLSYNQIEYIRDDPFVNNDNLEHLRLNNNQIRNLTQPLLSTLHSLKYLDLSNNPVIQFDVNITKLLLLEELNLTHVALTDDKTRFLTNTKIKNVSLRNNDLKELQAKTFANCTSLSCLDLGYNSILSIDKNALEQVGRLENLELPGNKLKNIPSTLFRDTKLLKYLDLSDNRIEVLFSGTFESCQNLVVLNLSHNHLQNLNEFHLHRLQNLQELYLQFNEIHNIKGVNYLKNLTQISIANNPWKCKDLFDVITTLGNSEHDVNIDSDSDSPEMYHVDHISCDFIYNNGTSANEGSSNQNISQTLLDIRSDLRQIYFNNYTETSQISENFDKHIFFLILVIGIINIFILCIHLCIKARKKEVHRQPDQHQLSEIAM